MHRICERVGQCRSARRAVAPMAVSANERTHAELNGCSSGRRDAYGGTGSAGRRPSLPSQVRITEAPIAGDHLLPAHFQASHAAILLHDAAADIAQRAPWLPITHKPLGYFRKIGLVLQVYNYKLSIETDTTIRARTAWSRRTAARCSYRSSLRSSGSTRRVASADR